MQVLGLGVADPLDRAHEATMADEMPRGKASAAGPSGARSKGACRPKARPVSIAVALASCLALAACEEPVRYREHRTCPALPSLMDADETPLIEIVFRNGTSALQSLTASIAAAGGHIEIVLDGGGRVEATVDVNAARAVCQHDLVVYAGDFETAKPQ